MITLIINIAPQSLDPIDAMPSFDLHSLRQHQVHAPTILAFGVAYLGLTYALRNTASPSSPKNVKVIPSPRETLLPKLSEAEAGDLPYPPDVFPGARDVDSPYGTIRVYEWGPEDGRKVLLIHGISTPCVSLGTKLSKVLISRMIGADNRAGGIANGLVDKGCRVMLLGRLLILLRSTMESKFVSGSLFHVLTCPELHLLLFVLRYSFNLATMKWQVSGYV